jgi:hypothetical protein
MWGNICRQCDQRFHDVFNPCCLICAFQPEVAIISSQLGSQTIAPGGGYI